MGCNCNKKVQPTGFAVPSTATQDAQRAAAEAAAIQANTTQSFTLRTSDGRTQSFGSRLEANAAMIRAGGGTIATR